MLGERQELQNLLATAAEKLAAADHESAERLMEQVVPVLNTDQKTCSAGDVLNIRGSALTSLGTMSTAFNSSFAFQNSELSPEARDAVARKVAESLEAEEAAEWKLHTLGRVFELQLQHTRSKSKAMAELLQECAACEA